VTGADDVLFGRAQIERAFTALGERLARRGVVADVFVVGGAAMALAYDVARVTRDVDAVFKPHGIGVDSADVALRICTEFYPDEPVSPRSSAVLHELFG
jgi:hypothetical protein